LPLPFETLFHVPSQPMTQKGKRKRKKEEKIEKEKEEENLSQPIAQINLLICQ